jgi:hypothetical protein
MDKSIFEDLLLKDKLWQKTVTHIVKVSRSINLYNQALARKEDIERVKAAVLLNNNIWIVHRNEIDYPLGIV